MGQCCSCGSNGIKLIYSCSGAANTGLLADSISRKLMNEGSGKMTCLAAVGADLKGFIDTAQNADKNVVIDGCAVACGKQIFEKNNLFYEHFILTELGIEKGKTEITAELIEEVSKKIEMAINN
ncbi:MAG: putative zinc-binding protein [Melioribacteraceae bacterium]